MLKISFTNAEVSDHGYGLEVNGKSLEDIISTALGTKLKGNGGYGSGLPSFSSNSYIGNYSNSYDNKCLLITAIKGYLRGLEATEGGKGWLKADSSTMEINVAKAGCKKILSQHCTRCIKG